MGVSNMSTLSNAVQNLVTDATKVIKEVKAATDTKIIGYADIEKARSNVVNAMAKEQLSVKAYAEILNAYWAAVDWFAVQWNDKGLDAQPMHKERDAFVSALQAKGHSNPRVQWQRIREAAKLMRYPVPKLEPLKVVEDVKDEEETKSVNSSPEVVQSTAAKYLATLIDKIQKAEAPTKQMLAALPHIKAALTELSQ